ncbi:MAG: phage terminase large subunit family protein [Pararobbsia sp.]
MGAIDAWTLAADAWRAGLALDPIVQVSEWSDENRVLTRKVAAEAGEWRTSRTPYLREPMDCLSVTSPVQDVVFVAGTQVGKSEAGLNWLGYSIDRVPGAVPRRAADPDAGETLEPAAARRNGSTARRLSSRRRREALAR